MHRAKTRTGIFSRWNEKPAGVAFAAIHNGTCMVHAVEVLAHQRRQGVAAWMMRSEEHTSELQSLTNLVCRLLLEKKKKKYK